HLLLLSGPSANSTTHPFPTRRSSDLGPCVLAAMHRRDGALFGDRGCGGCDRAAFRQRDRPSCAAGGAARCAAAQFLEPAVGMGQDRKSTRLNSSHVKISYAVFCLKKK